MTHLDKKLERETAIQRDGRKLIVGLAPSGKLTMRLKGKPTSAVECEIADLWDNVPHVAPRPWERPKMKPATGVSVPDRVRREMQIQKDNDGRAWIPLRQFRDALLRVPGLPFEQRDYLRQILRQLDK